MKHTLPIILSLLFITTTYSLSQEDIGDTQILILGTSHLSQLGNNYSPQLLDNVISKLNTYDFDAICIENMSGQLLYDIESRNDSAFSDLLEGFGGERLVLAKEYRNKIGVSFLEAEEKVKEYLKSESLSDIERVKLIEYCLASTDLATACLQYTYLQNPEVIDNKIRDKLNRLLSSPNEIYSLALRLARIEGLNKLEYIDNMQDETLLMKYFPSFFTDYMANQEKLSGIGDMPVYRKLTEITSKGISDKDLSELYDFVNSNEYMFQDFKAQWEIWLRTNFPSKADLSRYNLWEMRNLQICAQIMQTAAFYPDKKILVVIGSSHKSFLEKHLGIIPGIDVLEYNPEF